MPKGAYIVHTLPAAAPRPCGKAEVCVKNPLYMFTSRLPMKSLDTERAHNPLCWRSSAWLLSVPPTLHPFLIGQIATLYEMTFSNSFPSST